MAKAKKLDLSKYIALGFIAMALVVLGFFFLPTGDSTEVPSYVTGEVADIYQWAKTAEGDTLLEQVPCYCGCKYEGHQHARHCFWRDDGTFDKHGITCSVCLDIAKKVRAMQTAGIDVCTMRNTIDAFYLPNKHLGTNTPMPEGCAVNLTNIYTAPGSACTDPSGSCGG